jgi:hypothetical protein
MDIFSNKELYPGRTEHPYEEDEMKPKRIVDGWNAWFFDDMQRLIKVWAGFGENRQSVGTLWLGFLDYMLDALMKKMRLYVFGSREYFLSLRRCGTAHVSQLKILLI